MNEALIMNEKLTMQSARWACPSLENRRILSSPDQELIASFADPEELRRHMEENREEVGAGRYILPVWQNLEALVYGTGILNNGSYWIPGDYCVNELGDIRDYAFDFLSSPLIQALLKTIPLYKDEPLILEAEAPFSILAALMNPIDLYLFFEEEPKLMMDILERIADASAEYIKACLKAGCRIISLADPVGTMDLIGEEYYSRYPGQATRYLLEKCDPYLDKAIIHICLKMSQSMVIAGLAKAEPWPVPDKAADYMEILSAMAEDEGIHYTGMTCIHNPSPSLKKALQILPEFSPEAALPTYFLIEH